MNYSRKAYIDRYISKINEIEHKNHVNFYDALDLHKLDDIEKTQNTLILLNRKLGGNVDELSKLKKSLISEAEMFLEFKKKNESQAGVKPLSTTTKPSFRGLDIKGHKTKETVPKGIYMSRRGNIIILLLLVILSLCNVLVSLYNKPENLVFWIFGYTFIFALSLIVWKHLKGKHISIKFIVYRIIILILPTIFALFSNIFGVNTIFIFGQKINVENYILLALVLCQFSELYYEKEETSIGDLGAINRAIFQISGLVSIILLFSSFIAFEKLESGNSVFIVIMYSIFFLMTIPIARVKAGIPLAEYSINHLFDFLVLRLSPQLIFIFAFLINDNSFFKNWLLNLVVAPLIYLTSIYRISNN